MGGKARHRARFSLEKLPCASDISEKLQARRGILKPMLELLQTFAGSTGIESLNCVEVARHTKSTSKKALERICQKCNMLTFVLSVC